MKKFIILLFLSLTITLFPMQGDAVSFQSGTDKSTELIDKDHPKIPFNPHMRTTWFRWAIDGIEKLLAKEEDPQAIGKLRQKKEDYENLLQNIGSSETIVAKEVERIDKKKRELMQKGCTERLQRRKEREPQQQEQNKLQLQRQNQQKIKEAKKGMLWSALGFLGGCISTVWGARNLLYGNDHFKRDLTITTAGLGLTGYSGYRFAVNFQKFKS